MTTYELLDGRTVDLGDLSPKARRFLDELRGEVDEGEGYFELYRKACGPGSIALGGRTTITKRLADSPL